MQKDPGSESSASSFTWASLVAQLVKNPPAIQETWVRSLGWENPLERGTATLSIFWPGEFHGLCHPRDHKESDVTEQLPLSLRRATGACDPCSALASALKLYQWSLICYSISF